jgi:hypothetical protein
MLRRSRSELKNHLLAGAERLQAAPDFEGIASEVTLLVRSAESHFRDLEVLDACLEGLALLPRARRSVAEMLLADDYSRTYGMNVGTVHRHLRPIRKLNPASID